MLYDIMFMRDLLSLCSCYMLASSCFERMGIITLPHHIMLCLKTLFSAFIGAGSSVFRSAFLLLPITSPTNLR